MELTKNNNELQSIVIELTISQDTYSLPNLGRAIYAQVLQWFKLANPDLATTIHESSVSPLTISALMGHRRSKGIKAGDVFYFKIGIIQGNLVETLFQGLELWGSEPVILADIKFLLRQIYSLPGSHYLAGAATYQLLAKTPQIGQKIKLSFLSPTSFKQKKSIQSFPLPDLIFGSLQRRWNSFAPTELHIPDIEWEVFPSAFELKTYAIKLEVDEIGCQGWVDYYFAKPEQVKIAFILAQFAFFAGVGRKTSMGMGQVQLFKQ